MDPEPSCGGEWLKEEDQRQEKWSVIKLNTWGEDQRWKCRGDKNGKKGEGRQNKLAAGVKESLEWEKVGVVWGGRSRTGQGN